MEELSVECANIRAKIAENNKRIDERIKTIVRTEKFHKTRQLEIDEIESIEYQDGIDTTIMVITILQIYALIYRSLTMHEITIESILFVPIRFDADARDRGTDKVIGTRK